MDSNSHIKVLMDSFMENGKVLMCAIHKERSGSYLLKVRIEGIENGGLVSDGGEVTLNNSLYFRRKNKKQIDRDFNRSSNHHQANDTPKPRKEYDLRSTSKKSIENPRCTQTSDSDDYDTKLLSPEAPSPSEIPISLSVLNSPDPNLMHVAESTPEPPMHASLDDVSDEQLTIEPENNNIKSMCSVDPSFDPAESDSDGNPTSANYFNSDHKELKPGPDTATPTSPAKSKPKSPSKPASRDFLIELFASVQSEIGRSVQNSMREGIDRTISRSINSYQNSEPPDDST